MLLVGLLVGALAELIIPGRDPGGVFVTMLRGVAGVIGRILGLHAPGQAVELLMSIARAVLLLALYRLVALEACTQQKSSRFVLFC